MSAEESLDRAYLYEACSPGAAKALRAHHRCSGRCLSIAAPLTTFTVGANQISLERAHGHGHGHASIPTAISPTSPRRGIACIAQHGSGCDIPSTISRPTSSATEMPARSALANRQRLRRLHSSPQLLRREMTAALQWSVLCTTRRAT